jgi:hypothetical protein
MLDVSSNVWGKKNHTLLQQGDTLGPIDKVGSHRIHARLDRFYENFHIATFSSNGEKFVHIDLTIIGLEIIFLYPLLCSFALIHNMRFTLPSS